MTAELIEVVDQIHLIVIIELVRDLQPAYAGRRQLPVKSSLKTGDSSEAFWSDSNFVHETPLELPEVQPEPRRKRGNFRPSAEPQQFVCRDGNDADRRMVQSSHQEPFNDRDAFGKRLSTLQFVAHMTQG